MPHPALACDERTSTVNDLRLASWADVAKIVAAFVAVVVALVGSGFVWNELWHIPDLRYTVLPTYEVGGQHFSGLILENRGRAAASGVLLKTSGLDAPIEALEIQSDELFAVREGGEGEVDVAVWLDRLTRGASITLYLLTSEDVEVEDSLSIMADNGPAKPVGGDNSSSWDLWAGFALGFAFAGAVGYTSQRLILLRYKRRVRRQPASSSVRQEDTPTDEQGDGD